MDKLPLLQAYYQQVYPNKPDLTIRSLTTVGAGWESELYGFDVEYGPATARQSQPSVLRIYEGDVAASKAIHEFTSLRCLHQAGYPVPQVHLLEHERSPFDKPFLTMERVEGQVMWALLDRAPPAQQQLLLTQFCELFVRLHNLDWRLFADVVTPFDAQDPYAFVDGWLELGRDALQRFPQIDFDPILDWLYQRRDALNCERPSAVHGDFHPNNVLIRPDGSAVVIDWTGFSVTDARFDLAWTLTLASAYGGADLRESILRAYERLSGARVKQIETFEVFAYARRLFDIGVSLSAGAERLGMRPEAVKAMREQIGAAQHVYGLLVARTAIRLPHIERIIGLD